MSRRHGPAFSFWLDYLDARGGLWEPSDLGDGAVLAVLPEAIHAGSDLPETALITDDPDVSREDGVLFLGAGHPAIDKAAASVVADGDVGVLELEYRSRPLSGDELLAKIRDQVPVDHGRIDATGSPIRSARTLLRLETMIRHTVSAEEQFTETADILLDVPGRVAWTGEPATRLHTLLATAAAPSVPHPPPARSLLLGALAAANQAANAAATRRGAELAVEASTERAAEVGRAKVYYAAALAALDKRRAGADARRQELLDSRAEATRAERDRRLAEIDEKYRHQHELLPYRLHLIELPVLRLATDIRRGERRWPVMFDYLPQLGVFAPLRCPHCDAHAPLVATKAQLGCTSCVPVRAVTSAPTPTPATPATPPAARPEEATRKPAAPNKPKPQPLREAPLRAAQARETAPASPMPRYFPLGKPHEKKVTTFWNLVAAGEHRKLTRLVAPDSPLAALLRIYRAAGPLHGIGVPATHNPEQFTAGHYDRPVAGDRPGTQGAVLAHGEQHPYLLLWSPDELLEELHPYAMPWHLGRAGFALPRRLYHPPPALIELDPVAELLLTRTSARHGLPFATRALAAWWRLTDAKGFLARFGPRVLAAALDRAVCYWSGVAGTTYPETAGAFGADQDLMRKATPLLQKQLQLTTTTTNW